MKTHRAIKAFGKAVRQLRRQKGFTLEGLAGMIDADAAWLSKVERGEKNVTLLTAVRLAQALGVSLSLASVNLVASRK